MDAKPKRVLRSALAALFVAGSLGLGVSCSNSDAGGDDTQPRNNTEDRPDGNQPGADPGGSVNPQGEGGGTGRAEP